MCFDILGFIGIKDHEESRKNVKYWIVAYIQHTCSIQI